MRALLLSPEFKQLSFSLSAIADLRGNKASCMPLGLITVAALLPDHWDLKLVDLNVRQPKAQEWAWSEVILVSGMLAQREDLLLLVSRAKELDKVVVAGGPYPSALPEEVLDSGCEFVVRGEAEEVLDRVIRDLEAGLAGGIYESDSPPALSASPLPRFDLLRVGDYILPTIQTSRGCPNNCEFCDVVKLNGRKPRFKTPAQVNRELEELYRLGWRNQVLIVDDNLINNRQGARELARSIDRWLENKGRPFYFWFQASLDLARERDLIDALTQANFSFVFIGVETTERKALKIIRKTTVLNASPAQDLAMLHRNGLIVLASFMIGLDGESEDTARRIIDLADEAHVALVYCSVLRALPGTKLWTRLEAEERLRKEREIYLADPEPTNYRPLRPEADILKDCSLIWSSLYNPERFYSRAAALFMDLRPTRKALALSTGETPPQRAKPERRPVGYILGDLLVLIRLIIRRGIRSAARRVFWRSLLQVIRRNPSRWVQYIMVCAIGEHMFQAADNIKYETERLEPGPNQSPRADVKVALGVKKVDRRYSVVVELHRRMILRCLLVATSTPTMSLTMSKLNFLAGSKTLSMPLGLITVAALLPDDWELSLVDLNVRPLTGKDLKWAEVVFVSGMLPQRGSLLETVKAAKEAGKTVITGGPYPSSLPEEVKAAGCDFVVRGEAERILQEVIEDLEAGLPGGVYESEGEVDLTLSPLPRYDLLDFKAYNMAAVQTGRGCPFNCEFCDVINLNGRKLRFKTVEQVLGEFNELYRLGWRNQVFITDDNLIGNRERVLKLAAGIDQWLEDHGRPFYFFFQGSLNLAGDMELMDALTQANFGVAYIGVETTSEEALGIVRKTSVLRSSPASDLSLINRNGLTVMASLIIGLDGEPDDVAEGILNLLDEAQVALAHFYPLTPIPGTGLWDRLNREGRLIKQCNDFTNPLEPLIYLPQRPVADVWRDYHRVWSGFYEPRRFYDRILESFLSLRPTRRASAKKEGRPYDRSRPGRPPLGFIIKDILILLRIILVQGLLSSNRILFWRNLFIIWRRNPSRLIRYLSLIVTAEDMFAYQEHSRKWMEEGSFLTDSA